MVYLDEGSKKTPVRERKGKRKREEEETPRRKLTCRRQAAAAAESSRKGSRAGRRMGRPKGRPGKLRAGRHAGRHAGRPKGRGPGRWMDDTADDTADVTEDDTEDGHSDISDHPFELKTNYHNSPNDNLPPSTIDLVRAVQRTIDHLRLLIKTLQRIACGHRQRSNRLSKIENDLSKYIDTGDYKQFVADAQKFFNGGRKRRGREAAAARKASKQARDIERTIRELETALRELKI